MPDAATRLGMTLRHSRVAAEFNASANYDLK